MKQFKRTERVRNQILRDVRQLLDQELAGKLRGMVTFVDVEISSDLRYATIFYSVLGDDKDRLKAANYLSRIRGRVQGQLGRMLRIRVIPEIRFRYDDSIERGIRIQKLLNQIEDEKKNDAEKDT
jgi:ribosome-binding factor A